ncbi:uncharacterized protein l(2)SH0834 [Drosophila kikkawai]|uniref:Uncharacterized protein l(2)SH0834 n=1 Tax=Drosophila kikkawai TaxID=30033 RepID=A0A6P4IAP6_DROKI|nr:uncharacterized protein LOC108077231 [Drosophila kikkawai]KAH8341350.1 hypothetical protein KR059_003751 [Drosophila kikkawai]
MENIDTEPKDEATAKESIALRRELRRKKILEASKSRLDKLNGRATTLESETPGNTDESANTTQYSDPEVEPDIPIPRPFLPEQPVPATKASAPLASALLKTRVHIILAACGGFLLALYANSSVFVPVLLFVLVELAFLPYRNGDNLPASVAPMLLLFVHPNISSRIKQFSKLFAILQSLLGDLAITVCVVCSGSILLNLSTLTGEE